MRTGDKVIRLFYFTLRIRIPHINAIEIYASMLHHVLKKYIYINAFKAYLNNFLIYALKSVVLSRIISYVDRTSNNVIMLLLTADIA